jgi:hypothetical protein
MTPTFDAIRILDQLQELVTRLYKSIPWWSRWLATPLSQDFNKLIAKLRDFIKAQENK